VPRQRVIGRRAFASAPAWLRGGDTIVRVARLISFVGVDVRYAAENDLMPLEIRLTAVTAGGIARARLVVPLDLDAR
jgi:uncharacterized membrane protein